MLTERVFLRALIICQLGRRGGKTGRQTSHVETACVFSQKVSERQHHSVETIETSHSSFHKRQAVTEKAWWTLNHGETFFILFSVF